jgi:glycosyltransferase involved in cell wall biosynthesis
VDTSGITADKIIRLIQQSYERPNKVDETMPGPVASVFVATYNHSTYIRNCLDSIIAQKSSFPFELIIGEDCSTDGTREIVFDYARTYPQIIRVITADKNVGQEANWIRGLKACRGKYIALCDGDDYWNDPHKLEKQIEFMQANPEYSMCYHSYRRDISGELSGVSPTNPKDFTADELIATPPGIPVSTKLVMNVFKEAEFEILYHFHNDFPMNAYLGTMGHCKFLDSVDPSVYRIHAGGAFSSMDHQSKIHTVITVKIQIYQYFLSQNDARRTNISLKALKDYLDRVDQIRNPRAISFKFNSSGLRLSYRGMNFEFIYKPVSQKLKSLYKRIF